MSNEDNAFDIPKGCNFEILIDELVPGMEIRLNDPACDRHYSVVLGHNRCDEIDIRRAKEEMAWRHRRWLQQSASSPPIQQTETKTV